MANKRDNYNYNNTYEQQQNNIKYPNQKYSKITHYYFFAEFYNNVFLRFDTERTFLNGPVFLGVPPLPTNYCLLNDDFPNELDCPCYCEVLNPKGEILLLVLFSNESTLFLHILTLSANRSVVRVE